jgi:translation initiation factor 2 alpha subunit (eIF-2alpha)
MSRDRDMSDSEIADHFGESTPDNKVYEEDQKIYSIASRIKNEAILSIDTNLTPVGVALCNTFAHTIKAFYDFAETIKDEEIKKNLKALILKQESMPAHFIASQPKPQRPKK